MSESKVFIPHAESAWAYASVLRHLDDGKFECRVDAVVDFDCRDAEGAFHEKNASGKENSHVGRQRKDAAPICGGAIVTVDPSSKGLAGVGDAGGLPLQNTGLPAEGASDMTGLNYLHEPGILFNLRHRFFAALPYTYTGDILIAVNPYRWLDLYGAAAGAAYRGVRTATDRTGLAPHAYATSALAFAGLTEKGENQSILVSGESGAGKTETVKILMGHLAQMTAGNEADGANPTIQKIIASNPLLESFGNAKTIRNDNSSRFGKFTQLQFDGGGRMAGSVCTTYLLEKSRVVGHTSGERGYHIFYQLLAGPEEDKAAHGVAGRAAADFRYLTADGAEAAAVIEGKTDRARYDMTREALVVIGLSVDEVGCLFRALAGVLCLGELDFHGTGGDDDKSEVADPQKLAAPATLLGIDGGGEALNRALCFRVIRARNESVVGNNTPTQAAGVRDAMAKALYAWLFDWLVGRINGSTVRAATAAAGGSGGSGGGGGGGGESGSGGGTIALLDIFGFESFAVNRFEQLCINYANEKLQQKFTLDTFKTVQVEYDKEGIPWSHVDYADNAEVLSLIESRMGVIAILNEECLRPRGSDESFTSKLATLHADHPAFWRSKLSGKWEFGVKHYAGTVSYTAEGFIEKNKDAIGDDVTGLLRGSSNPLLPAAAVAAEAAAAAGGGGPAATAVAIEVPLGGGHRHHKAGHAPGHHRRATSTLAGSTLAAQFRTSLTVLMDSIECTRVQYVRCIKPNAAKSPQCFENAKVAEQLRCAGVIEAIRISRAAYPNRMGHEEFLRRFRLLASPTGAAAAAAAAAVNGGGAATVASSSSMSASSDDDELDEEDGVGGDGRQRSRALLRELLGAGHGAAGGYELGRTRVYFQAGVLETLEHRRLAKQAAIATQLQAIVRTWFAQARLRAIRAAATVIAAAERRRSTVTAYRRLLRGAVAAQSTWRRVLASRRVLAVRRERASGRIAAAWRGRRQRWRYRRMRAAAVRVQAVARGNQARRRVVADRAEALEAAKLENQIAALQRRLLEEQAARKKMEQAHQSLLAAKAAEAQQGKMQPPPPLQVPPRSASISPTREAAAAATTAKLAELHLERLGFLALPDIDGGGSSGFDGGGLGIDSPRTAAVKVFVAETERQRGSVDFMGESAQIIETLRAEAARLKKENVRLRDEAEELRRDKQRLANSYEASGMSYNALHTNIKKLAGANKKLVDEVERLKEQRDQSMRHVSKALVDLQNREEEGQTLRLLYESEVTTRKKHMRVMEAMVRLVAEAPPTAQRAERDELVQMMAAMYRDCLSEDPNVVSQVDLLSKGMTRAAEKTSSMLSSAKAGFSALFRAAR